MPFPPDFKVEQLTARDIIDFHRRADTDTAVAALHHTLGTGPFQASPGPHTHDGRDSKVLSAYFNKSTPITVTGSRSTGVALQNLLAALNTEGIIIDSTTA